MAIAKTATLSLRIEPGLIDIGKQQSIGNLVRESLVKQQQSRQLLERAKTRVKQLIEAVIQP